MIEPSEFPGVSLASPALASITSAKHLAAMVEMQEAVVRAAAEEKFANSAGGVAGALFEHIEKFERGTDDALEVGVRLVSFGQAVIVHVAEVGYTQPNLVWFSGKLDDGSTVSLIQHLSQLNFLLMRVPRLEPEAPKRPIGFHHPAA